MPQLDESPQSNVLGKRLQALGNDVAGRLSAISRIVELPADGTIICEGDITASIFAVSTGIARTFKLLPDGRRQIIGFLYAGDFLCANCHDHCGFGAEAATAISLLAFRRRDLEQLIEKSTEMQHMFLSDASSELAAAQDRMLLLGQKLANERVASFLLMLARRQGAGAADSVNKLQIPLRGVDVADYLGLTQETVSRCLCAFQREGIIRAYHSRHEIEIVSREKVENLSGGHSRQSGGRYYHREMKGSTKKEAMPQRGIASWHKEGLQVEP